MISLISIFSVLVCVALVVPGVDGADSPEITTTRDESLNYGNWLHSFTDAREQSRVTQLPILLHFEADWCGACRQMDSSVLQEPEVLQALGRSVIGVKVNADESPELISKFGISSLPTEIVLDGDGLELRRFSGGASKAEYLRRLSEFGREAAGSLSSLPDGNSEESGLTGDLRECLLVRRDGNLVGLGGYSPVAMVQKKEWLQGSADFAGTYQGVDYFFQSAEERELFFSSPEHYIPQLHGVDPVELQRRNRAAAGAIELGAFYKGRLFFFLSEANRRSFQDNPSWYAESVQTEDLKYADKAPVLNQVIVN